MQRQSRTHDGGKHRLVNQNIHLFLTKRCSDANFLIIKGFTDFISCQLSDTLKILAETHPVALYVDVSQFCDVVVDNGVRSTEFYDFYHGLLSFMSFENFQCKVRNFIESVEHQSLIKNFFSAETLVKSSQSVIVRAFKI